MTEYVVGKCVEKISLYSEVLGLYSGARTLRSNITINTGECGYDAGIDTDDVVAGGVGASVFS